MYLTFKQVLEHLLTLNENQLSEEFRIRSDHKFIGDTEMVEEKSLSEPHMHDTIYVSITQANNSTDVELCNLFDGALHE